MMLRWEDGRPIADAAMLAALYEVSIRTVHRHCRVVRYRAKVGVPRGQSGAALFDAFAAAQELRGVAPRPERTRSVLAYRLRNNRTPRGVALKPDFN